MSHMKVMLVMGAMVMTSLYVSCSSDSSDGLSGGSTTRMQGFVGQIGIGDIPQWLVDYVKQREAAIKAYSMEELVYQGVWEGQTIYYIDNPTASSLGASYYRADGTTLANDPESTDRIIRDRTVEWSCIYVIKGDPGQYEALHPRIYPAGDVVLQASGLFDSLSQNDALYIINSAEELAELCSGKGSMPEIDFGKYTLIAGRIHMFSIYSIAGQFLEKVEKDGDKLRFVLEFRLHEQTAPDAGNIMMDFCALYDKLDKPQVSGHRVTFATTQ